MGLILFVFGSQSNILESFMRELKDKREGDDLGL